MNYQSQYSRIGKHYCCTEDKLTTNESNIQNINMTFISNIFEDLLSMSNKNIALTYTYINVNKWIHRRKHHVYLH